MERLIKDGDIILDGTLPRYQKEKNAFLKLESHEELEQEIGLEINLLKKILKYGIYFSKNAFHLMPTPCKKWKPLKIEHVDNSDIHIEFFGRANSDKAGISIMVCVDYTYYSLKIEGFGKTWGITKEDIYE